MLIERVSPFSGKTNVMDLDVTEADLWLYRNGALLQQAFPNLSPAEREFIKSGFTQEDWDMMFPKQGEEDYN